MAKECTHQVLSAIKPLHLPTLLFYKSLLSCGVAYPCDIAVPIFLCYVYREGSPSTSNIENALAILQLRPLTIQLQHCNLSIF